MYLLYFFDGLHQMWSWDTETHILSCVSTEGTDDEANYVLPSLEDALQMLNKEAYMEEIGTGFF